MYCFIILTVTVSLVLTYCTVLHLYMYFKSIHGELPNYYLLCIINSTCLIFIIYFPTVPIRRNQTGNAWQNAFYSRSTRILVPVLYEVRSVLYPFHIHSVPVLYPFSIRSVLFCSRSVIVASVSVFGTRSEEQGFWELIYKNAS